MENFTVGNVVSVVFFSSRRRHTRLQGDWSSDVCSSDLTRSVQDASVFNSYLLESTLRFRGRNYVWTRIENVDRSSELILGGGPIPPGFHEQSIGRVQAYSFGYDRDFDVMPHLASAVGAQFTVYGVPAALNSIYGTHPAGFVAFIRFRPF